MHWPKSTKDFNIDTTEINNIEPSNTVRLYCSVVFPVSLSDENIMKSFFTAFQKTSRHVIYKE